MKNKKRVFLKLLFILVFFSSGVYAQLKDHQIYFKAKKLLMRREYDQALKSFDLLRKEYPNSSLLDGAAFWSANIMERQGKDAEAFQAYENFQKKYPKSGWTDDCERKQIGIAEKVAKRGNERYVNFIVNKLDSPNKKTKYQAAVSLGKLHDQRALPVLRQIKNNGDKDMGNVAKSLINNIEAKPKNRKPKLRVLPDNSNQNDNNRTNRRTINQPKPRSTESLPGYQKQRRSKTTPTPKIKRPSRQPQTKSRKPAVKRTPSTQTKKPSKSSPTKK